MKKIIIFIIAASMILVSCTGSNEEKTEDVANVSTEIVTQVPVVEATAEVTPEATAEPTATPLPDHPKYIFIVIGDGFGRGQMMMGEIQARIVAEDMNAGAVWESFEQQKMVAGKGESGAGGTAIATGYSPPQSFVAQNTEYQDLYTIMDRAKENGMSTGVVTNSFVLDATPATFLSHDDWRLNFDKLAERMTNSNVDYIAAGGLREFVPQSYYSSFDSTDARGKFIKSEAPDTSAFGGLLEQGYTPYLGMSGAVNFLEQVDSGTFSDEKSICLFSQSTMAMETYKMVPANIEATKNVPSLVDMTNAGIQTLGQNPNGFVMMIEEAQIDKRGHADSQEGIAAQTWLLNSTLAAIMDFYFEHPNETLVILTADHECAEFKYDEERLEEFKTSWQTFHWTDNADQMVDFLDNTWRIDFYGSSIEKYINYAIDSPWETVEEDRAKLYNYVTSQVSKRLGIYPTTVYHSWQLIPCYTTGVKAEEFARAEDIVEIPIIICEIMGWEPLPEVIQE